MLWSKLFEKIGKQPLSFTQHNHVTAVIDGKAVPLELRHGKDGRPFLVPSADAKKGD